MPKDNVVIQYGLLPPNQRLFYFERLRHDIATGSLRVELTPENSESDIYVITFDTVFSYHQADEGDLLEFLSEQDSELFPWPLFTVENSSYLKWFHEVSHGKYKAEGLIHYCISTCNELIDVLSPAKPSVWF